MLYISLIASALLLFSTNWMVRRSRRPGTSVGCTSLAFLVGPLFAMCILPAVAFQAVLIGVAALIWRVTGRRSSIFLGLSCGATLVAYGLIADTVIRSERDYASLRGRYPFESMEARVPAPKPVLGGPTLLPSAVSRLGRLEERFPEVSIRGHLLEDLHEDAVGLFVNSPGFGVTRMFRPSEQGLRGWLRREPVPSQPGPHVRETESPGEWRPTAADDERFMRDLLEVCIEDFVNPMGFGYIKNRRHVAGFESHRFSRVPEPAQRWTLQTLELVSLLLHDEPRVYVSDRLPEMDKMHGTPTRPLDRFERFALERLRQGEDIFAMETSQGLRMLGAVRSVKQCVKCHGGERGDLLGAFSYTLRAEKAEEKRTAMNLPGPPVVPESKDP